MKKGNTKSETSSILHKAEELLKKKPSKTGWQPSDLETLKLIHELEVHQIELEMQNEELMMARSTALDIAGKYTELYDFAPCGYFTLSKEGEIIELNLSGSQMLGKERLLLHNRLFISFVSGNTKPIFNQFIGEVFNRKTKQTCEITLSANGNISTYVRLTGIVSQDGKQCFLTAIDITDSKQAEEKIRQTMILMQASIESPKEMIIFSIDRNYQYLFLNSFHKYTMRSTYGIDVQAGMNMLDCITNDDDRRRSKINFDRAMNGSSHITIEEYGDFERYYYETQYNPIFNDKNEILGATAFSVNISDRMLAELTIRESERRYREMLENIELVAVSLDIHGNITFCNEYCLKLTGWKSEEIMGRNWFGHFIPAGAEIKKVFFASISKGQMPSHYENPILTRDGKLRMIAWNNTVLRDTKGVVTGTSSIGADITERKNAEEKIRLQIAELQRWQEVTLGREDRTRQLKQEVNDLLIRMGETIRYPSQKGIPPDPFEKNQKK